MFPAFPLHRFSDIIRPPEHSKSFHESLRDLGFSYFISLNRQMSEIYSLATDIFKDIQIEFEKTNSRILDVSQKIKNFGENKQKIIDSLSSTDPIFFINDNFILENVDQSIQTINQNQRNHIFVDKLLNQIQSDSVYDSWKNVLSEESLENLKKTVSDPNELNNLNYKDLERVLDEYKLRKISKKKLSEKKRSQKNSQKITYIGNYKVLPPSQLLLNPPPKNTHDWKPDILFETKFQKTNLHPIDFPSERSHTKPVQSPSSSSPSITSPPPPPPPPPPPLPPSSALGTTSKDVKTPKPAIQNESTSLLQSIQQKLNALKKVNYNRPPEINQPRENSSENIIAILAERRNYIRESSSSESSEEEEESSDSW